MCQTPLEARLHVPFTFWVGDEMVASPYLTVMTWFDAAEMVFSPGISTQAITRPVLAV